VRRLVPAVALAAAALLTGCDQIRPVAIEVNGREVRRSSVDRELRAIVDNEALAAGGGVSRTDGTLDSRVTAAWLTLLVEQEVIDGAVERRELEVTAADGDAGRREIESQIGAEAFAGFPRWLRERLVARFARRSALVRELGGESTAPTDAEVRAEYDEQLATLRSQCTSGRFVAHILVESRAEADAVAADLAAGGNFADLAREHSTDAQSAEFGGELFCLDPAQFVAEFSAAAQTLPLGQVSAPVETEFGFHLIRVSDTVSFEAVERQIRDGLEQEAGAGPTAELDGLVARAEVSVDPRYGTWRVREGAGEVEPPRGPTPTAPPVGP
jgi:foldase protein PrsA